MHNLYCSIVLILMLNTGISSANIINLEEFEAIKNTCHNSETVKVAQNNKKRHLVQFDTKVVKRPHSTLGTALISTGEHRRRQGYKILIHHLTFQIHGA